MKKRFLALQRRPEKPMRKLFTHFTYQKWSSMYGTRWWSISVRERLKKKWENAKSSIVNCWFEGKFFVAKLNSVCVCVTRNFLSLFFNYILSMNNKLKTTSKNNVSLHSIQLCEERKTFVVWIWIIASIKRSSSIISTLTISDGCVLNVESKRSKQLSRAFHLNAIDERWKNGWKMWNTHIQT